MNETTEKLNKIFIKNFPSLRSEADINSASMATLREWDSFSHMLLMLALDEEFGLKNLTSDDFAKLTSFQKISEFISSTK